MYRLTHNHLALHLTTGPGTSMMDSIRTKGGWGYLTIPDLLIITTTVSAILHAVRRLHIPPPPHSLLWSTTKEGYCQPPQALPTSPLYCISSRDMRQHLFTSCYAAVTAPCHPPHPPRWSHARVAAPCLPPRPQQLSYAAVTQPTAEYIQLHTGYFLIVFNAFISYKLLEHPLLAFQTLHQQNLSKNCVDRNLVSKWYVHSQDIMQ